MIVVADAGPLLLFEAAGRLELLQQLFGELVVPDFVAAEVQSFELRDYQWIKIVPIDAGDPLFADLSSSVDPGEAAAITIAVNLSADLLIVDDRAGRRAARSRNVRLTGSVGVVLEAKRQGLLDAVRPVLEEFDELGAWLSPQLVKHALDVAGE